MNLSKDPSTKNNSKNFNKNSTVKIGSYINKIKDSFENNKNTQHFLEKTKRIREEFKEKNYQNSIQIHLSLK